MSDTLAELAALLGPAGFSADPDTLAPHLTDWRGLARGAAAALLRPASTREVAAALALCHRDGLAVVPQGGNTGLVAGATPDGSGRQVVLSPARMRRVRALDPLGMTMTVEAGLPWAAARAAAEAAGCLLPLSFAADGSAQVGGVLATNAGGVHAVRHGCARDLALGVEAVLADGTVIEALHALRKDNTAYALGQLLIGSEGTLGVITAAVLRLVPLPRASEVAFCAVPGPEAALALFVRLRARAGAALSAFEYVSGGCLGLVGRHIPDAMPPFGATDGVLIELAGQEPGLRAALEAVLEEALEQGLAGDAVIADSIARQRALWRLREECSEAQRREAPSIRHDVSVPLGETPVLIARAAAACRALVPDGRLMAFGHLGDGNVHLNLLPAEGADRTAFLARTDAVNEAVHAVVRALGGSCAAEHGIGALKREAVADWAGPGMIAAMRAVKQALDPLGILNPGKKLPPTPWETPAA